LGLSSIRYACIREGPVKHGGGSIETEQIASSAGIRHLIGLQLAAVLQDESFAFVVPDAVAGTTNTSPGVVADQILLALSRLALVDKGHRHPAVHGQNCRADVWYPPPLLPIAEKLNPVLHLFGRHATPESQKTSHLLTHGELLLVGQDDARMGLKLSEPLGMESAEIGNVERIDHPSLRGRVFQLLLV
jgi:hypothetical protein